jgi:integrase/recombinase XerD
VATLPPNLLRRANGRYYVRVEIRGVKIWRSTGTGNLKEALPRYHALMADLGKRGPQAARKVPTVSEWWATYQETYSSVKRAPRRDEEMIRPFLARMGRFCLNDVTRSMAAKYLADRARTKIKFGPKAAPKYRTISSGTVAREHGFLQGFFQRALDDGLLTTNPFKGIERAAHKTRDRVLGFIEQEAYLKRLTPKYQRWLIFMLGTGVRLEECRNINYLTDIDFKRSLVRVTGKFGKTRDVPLPEAVKTILHDQYQAEGALWIANQQRFREVLNEAARREPKLRPIHPHALRHTFATRFLQAGGDIYILSKILGHASVTVTERVYAHLLKEDLVARSRGLDLKLPKVVPFTRSKPVAETRNAQNAE